MTHDETTFFLLLVLMFFSYGTTWLYVMLANELNRKSTIFISFVWSAIGLITTFAYLFNHISKL